MPGKTGGVDTQSTQPVDLVHPKHQVNETGRLGPRHVTGIPGQNLVGRRDSQGSGPTPESIHSRTATSNLQEDLPELVESELDDSLDSDEASQMLSSLEASRKSSRSRIPQPPGAHGSHPTPDPDDELVTPQVKPRQTPPNGHGEGPAPDPDDELISPKGTSPSAKPRVSVSSSDDPDVQKRKEEFKNELQPKLGFLDKHKKEITVTAAGGILVGIGAAAAIGFPPAGLCIYACGIMMLSMGLSKMMFALDDAPDNLPKPKPDEPKPKPDEPKPKPSENSLDDGKFMAVRKPVLEALTEGDGPIPLREDGSLDEDEAKKRLKKFAEESKLNVDPEELLEQISTGIQAGLPLSEVVAEAIADVLSKDKNVDPHDPEFKAVTNAILSAAEAMMNATSASEREQAMAEFLAKLKEMLPRMSDSSLDQLIAMTKGALGSAGTEEAKEVFTSVLRLLEAEKAERLLKQQQQSSASFSASAAVSKVVPEPPGPPPEVAKPKKSSTKHPPHSTTETGASEAIDLSISKNLVHFRVLSFELNTLERADRLNDSDRDEFLKAAREVLERPRDKRIKGSQFLEELKEHADDRFAQVIGKLKEKDHFK
ncbi:hypothetical protein [Endozoicomonas arenosclerae]|uniref:hypothetical protein n=1 Tax=Endozoicomonas arenosclerae TaxID=1633495 RepID=UPI000780ED5D|nr:hypothetical protein [Endozoicomonas arenosclerae]